MREEKRDGERAEKGEKRKIKEISLGEFTIVNCIT